MIRLTNPTGRKTPAHIVTIGQKEYFFSYQTCIAFRGPDQNGNIVGLRIANSWGPTTGRHFNELGCKDFHVLSDEAFTEILESQT